MKLSRKKLLKGCLFREEIEELLTKAEQTLKTWEPSSTNFVSAPIREQVLSVFKDISDVNLLFNGGYTNAERQRILIRRKEEQELLVEEVLPVSAIAIEGNFLFDRVEQSDFRQALTEAGISHKSLGDIWITGDKGAQAICTPEAADFINERIGSIRDVDIQFRSLALEKLSLPLQRKPRKITTIEASQRIDAIASAGFGLSRSKIIEQLKIGKVRLNWDQVQSPSHALSIGDKIQLEGKGFLTVLDFELTKKGRWRVDLLKE